MMSEAVFIMHITVCIMRVTGTVKEPSLVVTKCFHFANYVARPILPSQTIVLSTTSTALIVLSLKTTIVVPFIMADTVLSTVEARVGAATQVFVDDLAKASSRIHEIMDDIQK